MQKRFVMNGTINVFIFYQTPKNMSWQFNLYMFPDAYF